MDARTRVVEIKKGPGSFPALCPATITARVISLDPPPQSATSPLEVDWRANAGHHTVLGVFKRGSDPAACRARE
jgi:hypothetical protein